MNIEELREYCLSLGGVVEKIPFGRFAKRYDSTVVFYVCNHMFCLFDMDDFTWVGVRSTAETIERLESEGRSLGHPINPALKFWISLNLGDGGYSDGEVRQFVKQAYDIISIKYSTKK